MSYRVASMLLSFALFGCSSSNTAAGSPAAVPGDNDAATTPPTDDAGAEAAAPDKCAPAKAKSGCNNASSIIRGIATFDPSHFKPGATPILRAVLRHQFIIDKGEDVIGGRLHAFTSVEPKDITTGSIPFELDMCDLGTAMWSEENDVFDLVLILDENGNNDLDLSKSPADAVVRGSPDKGELVKLVKVDLSCHAPSPCVEATLDCVDGNACTTITPMTTCKKKTPSCPSDDAYCH